MSVIEEFIKNYHLYERGYLDDSEFPFHMYYTGRYRQDMSYLIKDQIAELDLEDKAYIDDFMDKHGLDVFDEKNFADLVTKWERINDLKEGLFNEYREEFDIEALIEAEKVTVEEILKSWRGFDLTVLIINHPDTFYDSKLTAEQIIEIASMLDYKDRLDFLDTVKYLIEEYPSEYPEWKNDENLLVYLKLHI